MPKNGDIHVYDSDTYSPIQKENRHWRFSLNELDIKCLVGERKLWYSDGNCLSISRSMSDRNDPMYVARQWHKVGVQQYKLPSGSEVLLVYNPSYHIFSLRECLELRNASSTNKDTA